MLLTETYKDRPLYGPQGLPTLFQDLRKKAKAEPNLCSSDDTKDTNPELNVKSILQPTRWFMIWSLAAP